MCCHRVNGRSNACTGGFPVVHKYCVEQLGYVTINVFALFLVVIVSHSLEERR